MKPTACLHQRKPQPFQQSCISYLFPKSQEKGYKTLNQKSLSLLMIKIHEGDARPYLEQIPRLREYEKLAVILVSIHFTTGKKQETCATRIRIGMLRLSPPFPSHPSAAISSVRLLWQPQGWGSLHSWPPRAVCLQYAPGVPGLTTKLCTSRSQTLIFTPRVAK